jgi:MFS transporter, SET family, sugar efflux transporter
MGIAFSTEPWMPFVMSFVVLGFAGAATSQLFTAVHDELTARPTDANAGVVAIVRMALTAGWVIGPVLGAFRAAYAGFRAMFAVVAVAALAQIIPWDACGHSATCRAGSPATASGKPTLRAMLPLLALTALYICAYAGESVKYAHLPIYLNEQLHFAPALSGAVIGLKAMARMEASRQPSPPRAQVSCSQGGE